MNGKKESQRKWGGLGRKHFTRLEEVRKWAFLTNYPKKRPRTNRPASAEENKGVWHVKKAVRVDVQGGEQ